MVSVKAVVSNGVKHCCKGLPTYLNCHCLLLQSLREDSHLLSLCINPVFLVLAMWFISDRIRKLVSFDMIKDGGTIMVRIKGQSWQVKKNMK